MLTGAIHVHSTYSDGELALAELRELYLGAGCAFACLSDHAEYFDAERLEAYRREAESLSDHRFRFVPGLEFRCPDRMHIVGYGVTSLVDTADPQAVIRHIRGAGGVSVVAHPADAAFPVIERFESLPHGVEAWNSKYDGRYAPRPATFALVGRLRRRQPATWAYYAQDLHWKTQYHGLFVALPAAGPSARAILEALATGAFAGTKDGLELPADGALPDALLAQFAHANRRSTRIRRALTLAHAAARRLGARVPAPIKSQVRRIF